MSSRRKEGFSAAIVGLFMLAVLVTLVFFTVVISGVDWLSGRRRVEVRVEFNDVGGLKNHDSVMYRGTKVGTVSRVELSPSNLTVVAEIDGDVVLRERYRISVRSLSLLGGNYLLLEEGEGEVLPAGRTLRGETPSDWLRDVTDAARELKQIAAGGQLQRMLDNFESASADVREVTGRIARGEGTVGKLLSSDDAVYRKLDATLDNAAQIAGRLNAGEGTLGKLLTDGGSLHDDLAAVLQNVRAVSDSLRKGEGLLGRLLNADDPMATSVAAAIDDFRGACTNISASAGGLLGDLRPRAVVLLDNLNALAEKAQSGESTIGRLLTEDSLYRDIQALSRDLRQVLDNYRDTTPISTFGSLIMGGL